MTISIELAQHVSRCILKCIEYIIENTLDFFFRFRGINPLTESVEHFLLL